MMAIYYEISTRMHVTSPKPVDYAKRKRLDAALDECWRQIYNMIAGNAGLDTRRAWTLKTDFDIFADKLEREGLPRGTFRHEIFYWRSDRSGEFVEFWQQRGN